MSMSSNPYFNQEWQLIPGPCACCGMKYRQAKSCWGGSGYMCFCAVWKPCAECGKCRGDLVPINLSNDKHSYTGHCQCRQQAELKTVEDGRRFAALGW